MKKNGSKAHQSNKCRDIEYTESKEIPHKTCDSTDIKTPNQKFEHKRKCLSVQRDGLSHEKN